eukprot:gene52103-71016_t
MGLLVGATPTSELTIDVAKLRSSKGMIRICLTAAPDNFPSCVDDSQAVSWVPAGTERDTALGLDPGFDGGGGAFADLAGGGATGGGEIDAAHAGLRGEGNKGGVRRRELATAEIELLLRENDDAAAFGGLVGERGELGGVGESFAGDAGRGDEVGGLASPANDSPTPP